MLKIIILTLLLFFSQIQFSFASDNIYYDVFYKEVTKRTSMNEEWAKWITCTIMNKCNENNIDPFLVFSLFANESNFNVTAVSPVGAVGIAQLMPETAFNMGLNPYNPEENISCGVQYLGYQLNQFEWAKEMQATYAIAAYNAGPNAVYEYGTVPPYKETYNLIYKVIATYNNLLEELKILEKREK